MSPDSAESRIGRLEREMAALQQQVSDVVNDVDQLTPVRESVVRVEERVKQVQGAVTELREQITADRRAAKERGEELAAEISGMRKEQADQARANKTQTWAAAVAIIVAVLGVGGTLAAALIGAG